MFFKKPIGIPQFNTGFRDLKTKVHVAVSIACYAVCLSMIMVCIHTSE